MLDKDKYKYFAEKNEDIPIFSRPWWLDAVCDEGHWDVILYEKNNSIRSSFPFFIKKKNILKLSLLPRLTQKLGPYFVENEYLNDQKIYSYFSQELPYTNYFDQNCHHIINNPNLFISEGFLVNNMRTCIIENIKDTTKIKKNFSKNRKYDLNKAEENKLKIDYEVSPNLFYEEHTNNLRKRGLKINYSKKFINKLYEASSQNKSGKILGVYDNLKKYHALCFVVWDRNYAYLIGLTTNSDSLKLGASTYLIYKAIYAMIDKTKNFDFEGSMDENIYKFYSSFGTKTKNYFKIKKFNPNFFRYLFK